MTRSEALARLRAQVDTGKPIIGAGAGTGLSAKLAEAGGADLIIIYNSGRYRMGGRGSLAGLLPYGDANAIVVDMAREVLPVVKETPVLAGVCGTDPFRLMDVFLDELKRLGFSGVQNFPTVGLYDGTFRAGLEETGMGFGLEVDMIRLARGRDFLTAPYVFSDDEATAMAEAGADVLVPHMGLTTGGAIGAESAKTLDESVKLVQSMHDAAKRVNPEILVLCHGGPIAEPDDAAYVLANTEGVVGFFGASSMERLPTEIAMTENMRRFKSISVKRGECAMSSFVKASDVRQESFDWGTIGWRLTPASGSKALVIMDVTLEPGEGHSFHRHPGQEEMIIVKQGRVTQYIEQESMSLGPGDSVYLDDNVIHASFNDGDETAHLQVVIGPSLGGDTGYGLEDVSGEEPWASLRAVVA